MAAKKLKAVKKAPAKAGAAAKTDVRKESHPDKVRRCQWADVDYWRSCLMGIDSRAAAKRRREERLSQVHDDEPPYGAPDNPALDALNQQWNAAVETMKALDPQVAWTCAIRDLPDIENRGLRTSHLLDVIVQFIDLGMYPPPEYMLALVDSLDRYYSADEKPVLEHFIFGRPIQKLGSHAERMRARSDDVALMTHVANVAGKENLKLQDAAVKVMGDLHEVESPEDIEKKADALLRRNRGMVKRTSKAEK